MGLLAINIILSFVAALLLHEIGHLIAARVSRIPVIEAGIGWGPKLFCIRIQTIDYHLRLLPLGAYIRMDMDVLRKRPLIHQLFVLLAGIAVNLILGAITWGTFFGTFNLALALGNLLPFYQLDGWKSGIVIFRRVFRRPSPVVEWSFTIAGGLIGLTLLALGIFSR